MAEIEDYEPLPEVPENIEVDPVFLALLQLAHFLDNCDDAVLQADAAAVQLERVGLYIQRLDDEALDDLEAQLAELVEHAIAASWSVAQREWLSGFLEHCGIELVDDDEDGDLDDDEDGDLDDDAGDEEDDDADGEDDDEDDEDEDVGDKD